MTTSTVSLLKGLLSSPVNPASCSCARGLAVAITELAGAVPGLGRLASASSASATTIESAQAFVPSRAAGGSSPSASMAAARQTSSSSSAVERLQAELRAPPPPPELAADGLVASREALWRQRLALLD